MGRIVQFYRWLVDRQPVHLAVVRRYRDANRHHVGELYMYGIFNGIGSYRLVGCSLDSLGLDLASLSLGDEPHVLDLKNDFLAPMECNRMRIGSSEPKDNDAVRRMIGEIPRRNIRLVIQNKFIEHVMDKEPKA